MTNRGYRLTVGTRVYTFQLKRQRGTDKLLVLAPGVIGLEVDDAKEARELLRKVYSGWGVRT
jgi:hypothetical protein